VPRQFRLIDINLALTSKGVIDATPGSTEDALKLSDNRAVRRLDIASNSGRQRPELHWLLLRFMFALALDLLSQDLRQTAAYGRLSHFIRC